MFSSLQTSQLSEAAFTWYADFLTAASNPNWRDQIGYYAEDAVLQANNRVPAHGLAAITAELERYWQGFTAIRYEPINVLGCDHNFAVEMLCHYTLPSGQVFTVPASGFITRNDAGRIQAMRLFADVTPIFG